MEATFEEREYETPLYQQLVRSGLVWAPGQVFEHRVGIDFAAFVDDPWLFRLHGLRRPVGLVLSDDLPPRWFDRRGPQRLPDFKLNLFLQAKRPSWIKRVPRPIRVGGFSGPLWRIPIGTVQQAALEALARRIGARGLVSYAAPAFHTHEDLFRHTQAQSIVRASTFPSALKLRGHSYWYYNRPGAIGIANPEPEFIEEPGLEQKLSSMGESNSRESGWWDQNLKELGDMVRSIMADPVIADSSRQTAFFVDVAGLDAAFAGNALREVLSAYFVVMAFCRAFAVDWYVVDPFGPRGGA